MKKPIAVANWKMNKTLGEGTEFIKELNPKLKGIKNVETVICPAFPLLTEMKKIPSSILIGAQNTFYEDSGTFTGEVSPLMLKGLCKYVIIGHSERRSLFHETDELINKKIRKALEHDFKPILCIGENREENSEGKTKEVITKQLSNGLHGIEEKKLMHIDIAYEPLWAISKGPKDTSTKPAVPEEIESIHSLIREWISKEYGKEASKEIRIQYGGSVKPENAAELAEQKNINGFLIGGASLKVDSFYSIIESLSKTKKMN
ncbi:MAG: triose-phosphate isomerase [archaeon]|nr:triose-phosphate isomerase [Candidatus Micrarchaeota archaeon]